MLWGRESDFTPSQKAGAEMKYQELGINKQKLSLCQAALIKPIASLV